jgi:hypothetical protein
MSFDVVDKNRYYLTKTGDAQVTNVDFFSSGTLPFTKSMGSQPQDYWNGTVLAE